MDALSIPRTSSSSFPSSPRTTQLGFLPSQEEETTAKHHSTIGKVEQMDHDGMEDIWAELRGGDFGEQAEQMDYEEMLAGEEAMPELSMHSPAPLTTRALKSESVSDEAGVPSTTSAKTTPESSNPFIVSPSMSCYEQSPNVKESNLTTPATSIHSSDSIAQMLEFMRACNSQDGPPSSYATSNPMDSDHQCNHGEEDKGERKMESSNSRNGRDRKQLSPILKVTRSFSHGGESNGLTQQRPGLSAIHQKARQRSKTTAAPPPLAVSRTGEAESLHIDTHSAVKATGPSGAKWENNATGYFRQNYSVSAGIEAWSASESPTSSQSVASRWPMESSKSPPSTSHTKHKGSNGNLSLTDFLKRPEGTMWFQHFQKQYSSRAAQSCTSSAPFNAQQQQSSTAHSSGMLSPSVYSQLPPSTDVAQMLDMQQVPNQALVQAFQTAFVLGMQQLGMSGHFRPTSTPLQAPQMSQQYPDPWGQQNSQQQQHLHSETSMKSSVAEQPNYTSIHPPLPTAKMPNVEADDASAVLQSLLHDINQLRPDQQEYSVDEFLTFVAKTVEGAADDSGKQTATEGDVKVGEENASNSTHKALKTTESGSEAKPPEKKKNKKRTTSISRGLNGTHLDDVAEDGVEGRKLQEGHHQNQNQEFVMAFDEAEEDSADDRESEEERLHKTPSTRVTMVRRKGPTEKEANKLAERRRRRRESHNAVERRRRDHINERIAELASLLPESMLLDAIAASTSGGTMPHIDLSLFTRRPTIFLDLADDSTTQRGSSHHDLERKANALAPVHSSSETLALAQSKPNKGIILSKSVEYIKHLHEFCSVLRNKNRELQQDLDLIKNSVTLAANNPTNSSYQASRADEGDTPTEDSTMATATPPPNLATWLTQYREEEASQDEGIPKVAISGP